MAFSPVLRAQSSSDFHNPSKVWKIIVKRLRNEDIKFLYVTKSDRFRHQMDTVKIYVS